MITYGTGSGSSREVEMATLHNVPFMLVHYTSKDNLCTFSDGWMGSKALGCYQFLDRAVNLFWVEAQQLCEEIGGYLAEPRTPR